MNTIDSEQITKLLRDPIIVRIVSVLDIVSLSILELLEYDLTRNDINHALSNGVVAIDKAASSVYSPDVYTDKRNMLVSGDYYFYNFLNSKVKLTDVGLYILGSIKGVEKQPNNNMLPNELDQIVSTAAAVVENPIQLLAKDGIKKYIVMIAAAAAADITLHYYVVILEVCFRRAVQ